MITAAVLPREGHRERRNKHATARDGFGKPIISDRARIQKIVSLTVAAPASTFGGIRAGRLAASGRPPALLNIGTAS
ncbi:MAG TPA: hypothetical protein VGN94_00470 [Methylobacterium sp.]|nr:hypothetical protein [Methylobacterium sp.]